MKVCIIGNSGYIGSHVVVEALKKNIAIKGYDISQPQKKQNIKFYQGSIADSKKLSKAIAGCSTVIHLAAVVGNPKLQDNLTINYEYVKKVLQVCKQANIQHLIFTSSVSAIRKQKGPYGDSKYRAEQLIKSSGIPYTIFRPTLVYGDRSQGLERITKNIKRFPFFIPLVGRGSYLRQPIYVKDLATLLVAGVHNTKAKNKIYAAGGAQQLTFKKLVKNIASIMKVKKIIIPIPLFVCNIMGFIFEKTMNKPFFTREHIRSLSEDTTMNIQPLLRDFSFTYTPLNQGLEETLSDLLK